MTAVVYEHEAERDLLLLAPSDAEVVWLAIERFASTGMGFVRRTETGEVRLYVDRFFATLELTPVEVRVLAIVTRR